MLVPVNDFYMTDSTNDPQTMSAREKLGWTKTSAVLHSGHPIVEAACQCSIAKDRPFNLDPMGENKSSSIDFSHLQHGKLFKDFHQVLCKFFFALTIEVYFCSLYQF